MKLEYKDINVSNLNHLSETKPIINADYYCYRPYGHKFFDSIIDIGANTGTASLFCKMLFPTATIHTFEPNPRGYASCVKLRHLMGRQQGRRGAGPWHVYNLGLGDGNPVYLETEQESNTRENIFKDYNEGGKPALGGSFAYLKDNPEYKGEVLETITFPDLIKLTNVDLNKNVSLKIDCECCEVNLYTSESIEILRHFRHIAGEIHFENCLTKEEHLSALKEIAKDDYDLQLSQEKTHITHFQLTRKEDNIKGVHERWTYNTSETIHF